MDCSQSMAAIRICSYIHRLRSGQIVAGGAEMLFQIIYVELQSLA